MRTSKSTIDFIISQLSSVPNINTRRMFGEYALYQNGKVVGLICKDTLFVKITDAGKKFVGKYYQEGKAYPTAKVSMVIDEDRIIDEEWISELISITAKELTT